MVGLASTIDIFFLYFRAEPPIRFPQGMGDQDRCELALFTDHRQAPQLRTPRWQGSDFESPLLSPFFGTGDATGAKGRWSSERGRIEAVATKKPVKPGTAPRPEPLKLKETEPDEYPEVIEAMGEFQTKGDAMWDHNGEMVIDENGDIPEEIAEDLYFHPPSGTMMTYYEGDEFEEGSGWYKNPPREVADFISEEKLAAIAALPDIPKD